MSIHSSYFSFSLCSFSFSYSSLLIISCLFLVGSGCDDSTPEPISSVVPSHSGGSDPVSVDDQGMNQGVNPDLGMNLAQDMMSSSSQDLSMMMSDLGAVPEVDMMQNNDLSQLWQGGIVPGSTEGSWRLSHSEIPCLVDTVISPSIPEEANHFAATRLTLPIPFSVTEISYYLSTSDVTATCTPTLAHEIHLYVVDADGVVPNLPSRDALSQQVLQVEADPSQPDGRLVTLTLENPIELDPSQSLVISVQMKLEGEQHLCIGYCTDRQPEAGSQLWSSAPSEPYVWTDLSNFGLNEAYIILIEGMPL